MCQTFPQAVLWADIDFQSGRRNGKRIIIIRRMPTITFSAWSLIKEVNDGDDVSVAALFPPGQTLLVSESGAREGPPYRLALANKTRYDDLNPAELVSNQLHLIT